MTYVESSEKLGQILLHLKQCNVLADAHPPSRGEIEIGTLHLGQMVLVGLEPAFGTELRPVLPKDAGVSFQRVRVDGHHGPGGDVSACDFEAAFAVGRDVAFEQADAHGIQAGGFLQDGVEIAEIPHGLPGRRRRRRRE